VRLEPFPSEDYAAGMKKNGIRSWGFLVASFLFAGIAQANVAASPGYYNFGPVAPGQTATTMIRFTNFSAEPISYFSVNCSGDFVAFRCSSYCSSIPAYGSCSMTVTFSPRNGDGLSRMVVVNGQGDGNFASATVQGIDRKE
jgi:hypothetical protein